LEEQASCQRNRSRQEGGRRRKSGDREVFRPFHENGVPGECGAVGRVYRRDQESRPSRYRIDNRPGSTVGPRGRCRGTRSATNAVGVGPVFRWESERVAPPNAARHLTAAASDGSKNLCENGVWNSKGTVPDPVFAQTLSLDALST